MLLPMIFDGVFDSPMKYQRKRDPFLDIFDDEAPAMKLRRSENIPKTDDYILKIDCRGYSIDELKIDVDNDILIVEGRMFAGDISTPSGTLERNFIRKIQIPEDVIRETLKSEFKDGKLIITAQKKVPEPKKINGKLIITAQKKVPEPKKISIPINFVKKDVPTPPPTPVKSTEALKPKPEDSPAKKDSETTEKTCANCQCEKKLAPSDNPEVVVEVEE
uniref:SHSP domain-containing protein n=1 Tax=Panagrolaimus sp. JU765 TaxID=591449 RepID=A0AC34R0Z6_9BILA